MKRIFLLVATLILFCFSIFFYFTDVFLDKSMENTIYVNANDTVSEQALERLCKALRHKGKNVVFSYINDFKSGLFNLYVTDNDNHLPKVKDKKAINMLWIPSVAQGNPEKFREYDVIVVQSMSSFLYLKAINVRTAYIPPAIDIKQTDLRPFTKNYPMYYGNNETGFSLSLYLAGPTNLKVDVYGKGFEYIWDKKEIINDNATAKDFQNYPLVLVDQTDENIRDEIINERIIEVIEKGGVPYVRYNNGIAKMFDKSVLMYSSDTEFLERINYILKNPEIIKNKHREILKKAKQWTSYVQADKFIELFDIMLKKMH